MIDIRYTHFSTRLSNKSWSDYFHRLPEAIQGKINRYKRWQGRQAALFGKLLLLECLKKYGYPSDCLNSILCEQHGRPYLDHKIDFNISHSSEYVVCSITDAGRIGIDIERIKTVDLADFEQCMTIEEWKKIKQAANRCRVFYNYWTIKESVLKADGRGLSFPLSQISIEGRTAKLYENIWFLREINISSDYSCHLATNVEAPELYMKEISFR